MKKRIMRGGARAEVDLRTGGAAASGSSGDEIGTRPAGVRVADWAVGETAGWATCATPGGAAETSIMRHEVKSTPGNTWPRYELDSAPAQGSQARRLRHAEDGVDTGAGCVAKEKPRKGWLDLGGGIE